MEQSRTSKLVRGRIPAHTECPYKTKCPYTQPETKAPCNHRGIEHTVDFSCGAARWFDLTRED